MVTAEEHDQRIQVSTQGRNSTPVDLIIEQTARSHWISHGSTQSVSKKEKLAQKERDLNERQADVLEEVRDYWANTYQGIDSKKIYELCSDHFDSPKKALSTLKELEKHGLLLSSKTSLEGKGDVRLFKPYVYPG